MSYQPVTRDCSGRPVLSAPQGREADGCGPFTAVRWVPELPAPDWRGGLQITPGYATGVSGPGLPQAWLFFEDLEPALVFGRAARMSATVTGYGVYRAAEERSYDQGHGDERYLWLAPGPLDREVGEVAHFRAWIEGLDPRSSHWAGRAVRSQPPSTVLSGTVLLTPFDLPAGFRRLPGGRRTAAVINTMAAELRGRGEDVPWQDEDGEWTGGASIGAESGERFSDIHVDALCYGGKIPAELADWLHRLTGHAGARMWAEGYEGPVWGGDGPCTYWAARCPRDDAAAVMLAALDLLLAKRTAIAEWYLASPCKGLCPEHRDQALIVCPSHWCAAAAPGSPCTCPCEGAHHATGNQGIPPGSITLDWAALPSPARARDRRKAAAP